MDVGYRARAVILSLLMILLDFCYLLMTDLDLVLFELQSYFLGARVSIE